MAKTVVQVLKDVDDILARSEAECVKALIPVMIREPQPNQIYACLELFHMQAYQLIYNAFSIKDGKLLTDYGCIPEFSGKKSFVPELATYFEKVMGQLEWGETEGQDFTTQHEKQFMAWFKKVWSSAGGEKAKVPVYFCFEKEYRVQNLKDGKVMEELEAAQALGHNVTESYF